VRILPGQEPAELFSKWRIAVHDVTYLSNCLTFVAVTLAT
jgi:hypothetical protein